MALFLFVIEIIMKKSFIFLVAFSFVLCFPMLFWQVETVTQGKILPKNEVNIQDNLKLWAFNSRPFIAVQAIPKCDKEQKTFKIKIDLYLDKQKFLLQSQEVNCSAKRKNIKVISKADIPRFETISKLEITSTANLEKYKIIWYNAQP